MTIYIIPNDISPLVSHDGAFVAVQELRARGYNAFVGERAQGDAGPANVEPSAWDAAVHRVVMEINADLTGNQKPGKEVDHE